MFKKLLENLDPIIPKIEGGSFDKDDVFDNKDILKKGVYRESILEDGDNIILVKEYTSKDNSIIKIQKTILSKDDFSTQANNDITTKSQIIDEKLELRSMMEEYAAKQDFESAAILRDKIGILSKVLDIKK